MSLRRCLLAVLVGTCPVQAAQITLTTGETLAGNIVEQTAQALTLDHPILGTLIIAAEDVTEVSGAVDAEAPATSAGEEDAPPQGPPALAPSEPPAAPSFFDGWDARLEVGLSGTEGNSEIANFRLGFNGKKETERERWLVKSSYYYATSDGDATRNEINLDLSRHWLNSGSPWFTFAEGIYDFNEFKAWDHRVSGFVGVGYEFAKSERLELLGQTGGGLTKEFGGANDLKPEGLISAGLIKWQFTDDQTLAGSITLYPDLSEFGKFRVISKLEWLIRMSAADGLMLKFGVENEYESETEDATKHSDLKYYGSLVIEF